NEGQLIIKSISHTLENHGKDVTQNISENLEKYFDPKNGHLHERINQFVKKDGELENALGKIISEKDSIMRQDIDKMIGPNSEFSKKFDPENSNGIIESFRASILGTVKEHSHILKEQLSLNNKTSAICLLMEELRGSNKKISDSLGEDIKEGLSELSLDKSDSALSKLVKRMENAQKEITNEFSIDNNDSSMNRLLKKVSGLQEEINSQFSTNRNDSMISKLSKTLNETRDSINMNLTLDNEKSSLYRMRNELVNMITEQNDKNNEFKNEIKTNLLVLDTIKKQREKSTLHGHDFEARVGEFFQSIAKNRSDILIETGNKAGKIKNSKKGDFVYEFNNDKDIKDYKIVIEAKNNKQYKLSDARDEMKVARENRDAKIGIFVWSSTCPEAQKIDRLTKIENDIYVVWNHEDEGSNILLEASFLLAVGLLVEIHTQRKGRNINFENLNTIILKLNEEFDLATDLEKNITSCVNATEKIQKNIKKLKFSIDGNLMELRKMTSSGHDIEVCDEKVISLKGYPNIKKEA
ncbi:hypothetical protein OAB57_02730, partial [Bacteriovoracaceae bacterium]|nr:hypothetical protein [Bacteriovoracaceae bacterium]